jgi:hypothetical protein
MSTHWAAILIALVGTVSFAADPPKLADRAVYIGSPSGWTLDIRSDGSADLRDGSDRGRIYPVPAGTFDAKEVLKALEALKFEPQAEGRQRTHYSYWFHSEWAKAPKKATPRRYSQDEAVVVPLFDKAAMAGRVKDNPHGKKVLEGEPFALPPAAKLKTLYTLHTPSGWLLDIRNDGSAELVFGAGGPDTWWAPAGIFKPEEVRKALDGLEFDPKGSCGSHFVVWYEEDRKDRDGPQARYTRDEKVTVSLFEKALEACKAKPGGRLLDLLGRDRPPFGLKQ